MLRLLSSAVEASREELSRKISPLWNSGGADKSASEAVRLREKGNALLQSGDLDGAMRYVPPSMQGGAKKGCLLARLCFEILQLYSPGQEWENLNICFRDLETFFAQPCTSMLLFCTHFLFRHLKGRDTCPVQVLRYST